jgi:hypothetical protein
MHVKPWEFKGRRTERNAPRGRRCDELCTHPNLRQGASTALCTVCHEVFGAVTNFDRHRKDGWCLSPFDLGMRTNERGVWVVPMSPDAKSRLRGGVDDAR